MCRTATCGHAMTPTIQPVGPDRPSAWLRLVTPFRRVTSPRFFASGLQFVDVPPNMSHHTEPSWHFCWATVSETSFHQLPLISAQVAWKASASMGLIFTNSLGMPGSIRTRSALLWTWANDMLSSDRYFFG